ncbi:MAG: response regulator [Acidobacteria bacterium]|nr:response regulator [Acidobacteriota bacterium]
MNVIIAEDDTASRLLLEAILQNAGHEVVATENGQQALAIWQQQPCPVLITDWYMPEMDGLMLCRAIRQTAAAPYTYIVLLTAHGGKANYLDAMQSEVDDFLTKPVDEEQLVARLHVAERILGLRQHVKQLEILLPICAWCKKIRDEGDQWTDMESYMIKRTEVLFSHGACPECAEMFLKEAGITS